MNAFQRRVRPIGARSLRRSTAWKPPAATKSFLTEYHPRKEGKAEVVFGK